MTEEEREARRLVVRSFMSELADWIVPWFPHHSVSMKQELGGAARMSTDRWNHVACVLASLHSIPGEGLTSIDHTIRNVALSAIPVAQKMAAAALGCTRDPDGCMDFAAWRAQELLHRMKMKGDRS